MSRRVTGWALLAGAAAGGTALGYLAERRLLGGRRVADDPEWLALHEPLPVAEHEILSADGTRLHVVEAGPADAPAVVLAHGYGLGWRIWHHQVADLSDSLRVLAYDQRGHGRSARPPGRDYSAEAIGRDLAAVLDALLDADERAVVVGHSMGGMAILAYAEAFPDALAAQVAGAVLLSTGASRLVFGSAFSTGMAALGALEQRLASRASGGAAPGGEVTSDLTFLVTRAVALNPDASPVHVAFVEELLLAMPREAKAAFARTLGSLDLSKALRRLRVPTTVVVGDRDRLTPTGQARALVEGLPEATFVELPGVGHHPSLEAHDAVTAIVRAHVRRCLGHGAAVPEGGR